MISAWARICKIMGSRFAPYLPHVMGPIMKTASLKPEVALLDNDELNGVDNDTEDWQFVSLGDQQNFGIKTAGLEDKATACQMLVCYARELKEHFVEYAEQTVKLMVPMLKFYFHDGVRTAATESIPFLLECAKVCCEVLFYPPTNTLLHLKRNLFTGSRRTVCPGDVVLRLSRDAEGDRG